MQNFMKNMMVENFLRACTSARGARQISSCKLKNHQNWPRRKNILHARAEVRVREKKFCNHILHKILHLVDTFDVSISLKMIAVDVFEMYAFS